MSATLILGLLNVLNLYKGMWRPGCTGREIPQVLFLAIPFAAGLVSVEAPWFAAIVMAIPVVTGPDAILSARILGWQEVLFEYGMLYLGYFGLVLTGNAARKAVVMPLIVRLRSMK